MKSLPFMTTRSSDYVFSADAEYEFIDELMEDLADVPTRVLRRMLNEVYEDLESEEPAYGAAYRYRELCKELDIREARAKALTTGVATVFPLRAARNLFSRQGRDTRPSF
ncbi:hypothetical protein [Arthrobacter sp. NPDC092385]|uniref:hypothetical protein n=1 Tax=Arthrobacter sp. NPDC092385 TaxID=3363943 RepID=UPI00381CF2A1